jgi:hypothetical protein
MRAWLVYAGLTLPLGLSSHALFELGGGVAHRAGSIVAQHSALICGAAVAMMLAIAALRRGAPDERRLRMSLLRRALPSGGRLALAGAALQALVAIGTLGAEGVSIDADHVAFALAVALVSLIVGAVAFSAARDSILAFAAALIGVAWKSESTPRFEVGSSACAHYTSCTIRLRAGRGPPVRAASVA